VYRLEPVGGGAFDPVRVVVDDADLVTLLREDRRRPRTDPTITNDDKPSCYRGTRSEVKYVGPATSIVFR